MASESAKVCEAKRLAEAKKGRFGVGDKMPWCGVGSKVDRKYFQDMNKRQKVYL